MLRRHLAVVSVVVTWRSVVLELQACMRTVTSRDAYVLSVHMHGMSVELFCVCDCCVEPVSFCLRSLD